MLNNEELEKVFSATIELWFDDPRGSSAMEISKKLNYEHDDVIKAFAELELQGLGSAKKDVLMYSMTVKIHGSSSETVSTPFQTSIFFPDKNELSNRYHASSLAKLYHPEYTRRLHLGASQVGLVFFSEDVLARYILNPGKFEVRDDLSGGDIRNNSSSTSESFIHIRYGKARLKNGDIAVTAIFKDLHYLNEKEQSYWHAHELTDVKLDMGDLHFRRYVEQNFMGEWVDTADPLRELLALVNEFNELVGGEHIFRHTENVHLTLPVTSTYKAFVDSCSELYKLIGPDSIRVTRMKEVLLTSLKIDERRMLHTTSGRSLSCLQLLSLLEDELDVSGVLSKPIEKLKRFRIDADHCILDPDVHQKSYSREFADLCEEIIDGLSSLATALSRAL